MTRTLIDTLRRPPSQAGSAPGDLTLVESVVWPGASSTRAPFPSHHQTLGACNALTKAEITRARATTLMLGGGNSGASCLWGPQWSGLHDSGLLILRRLSIPCYPLALLSLSYSLLSLPAAFWNDRLGGIALNNHYTGLDSIRLVS
jgi:hypothetical protein